MLTTGTPLGRLKIRILDLSSLLDGASDSVYAGMYIVARLGADSQRTDVLRADAGTDGTGGRVWNEVFMFEIEGNSAPPVKTPPSTPSALGVDSAVAPHLPSLHERQAVRFPGSSYTLPQQSPVVSRGLLSPPSGFVGGMCGLPTLTLELWRHSPESDDCLAKYQFCIPLEMSDGNVIDRVVRLTSASPYVALFALRIRVALLDCDWSAMGYGRNALGVNPMSVSVLWRR
uniref:Uncharacterized protein TCIL3000_4_3620 n=1 Tax=Trypanosoma congolense (strain IL3000) TaxID=1068625 RepID=G0ULK5_TRYCI|nr:unnamed protein product [Trypanosoma congolense IL3000]